MRKIKIFSSLLLVSMFIAGCNKENLENTTPVVSVSEVSYNGHRILKFRNKTEFDKKVVEMNSVLNQNSTDIKSQPDGFVSMKDAFDMIVADDIRYADNNCDQHTNLILSYPNAFVTKYCDDGAGYYDLNICEYYLSNIVNPDGLVIIGDSIYQYTHKYIKVLKEIRMERIPILMEAEASNENMRIAVSVVNYANSSGTASYQRKSQKTVKRHRVILYETFVQNTSNYYPSNKVTAYWVTFRSLQRRLFGLWYDNYSTNMVIAGRYEGNRVVGWLTDNEEVTVNYTSGYSNGTFSHTMSLYLPYNQVPQSSPNLRTNGNHPTIYSTFHEGAAKYKGDWHSCSTSK